MSNKQRPVKAGTSHVLGDVYTHPAFGKITMVKSHSNQGTALFGSDLDHTDVVCITIGRAEMARNHNTDWFTGGHDPVVQIQMSTAQFADFITSGGSDGVPCTFVYAPVKGTSIERCPDIERVTCAARNATAIKSLLKMGESIMAVIAGLMVRISAVILSSMRCWRMVKKCHAHFMR